MAKKSPTRREIRAVACPKCRASPGHPCVKVTAKSYWSGPTAMVRESNHEERITAFTTDRGGK